MLTLSSYLEERAAKLKKEALGRVLVVLAGSPPNCLFQLLESFFGYKETTASASESTAMNTSMTLHTIEEFPKGATAALPPFIPKTSTVPPPLGSGSESETRSSKLSPETTKAVGFKPGPVSDTWTDTGLAAEYIPHLDPGGTDYCCPFPNCARKGVAQKDTMATHVRRDHLNVALACHYCTRLFWSREGWMKHCKGKHSNLPPVPANITEDTPDLTPQGLMVTLQAIKSEEARVMKETAPNPSLATAEPEHVLVTEDSDVMVIDE